MIIPLGTTRPRRRIPYATFSLMTVCVAMIGYIFGDPMSIQNAGFIPADPSLWKWFVSLFLHAGLFHLAGNLLFLWLFGTVIEDVLGPALLLTVYFGGGVCATLLDWSVSAAYSPGDLLLPRIGASGAIASLMGLAVVCFMRTKVHIFYFFLIFLMPKYGTADIPIAVFGGVWVVWEMIQGYVMTWFASNSPVATGGVAHWAHVGGFVCGALIALGLRLRKKVDREDLISGTATIEDSSGYFSEATALQRLISQEGTSDPEALFALGRAQEIDAPEKSAEAYGKALQMFLLQQKFPRAAETFVAMKGFAKPETLPKELLFDLACALEDGKHAAEAYTVFLMAAQAQADTPQAHTALIRAGELARKELKELQKAGMAYQLLLEQYPHSHWAGLAQERLRDLAQVASTQSEKIGS